MPRTDSRVPAGAATAAALLLVFSSASCTAAARPVTLTAPRGGGTPAPAISSPAPERLALPSAAPSVLVLPLLSGGTTAKTTIPVQVLAKPPTQASPDGTASKDPDTQPVNNPLASGSATDLRSPGIVPGFTVLVPDLLPADLGTPTVTWQASETTRFCGTQFSRAGGVARDVS